MFSYLSPEDTGRLSCKATFCTAAVPGESGDQLLAGRGMRDLADSQLSNEKDFPKDITDITPLEES